MIILIYNMMLNFISSVLFFWSLTYLVSFINSADLDFFKLLFKFLEFKKSNYLYMLYYPLQLYCAILLFSVLVKLGIGPFVFLKFHIYKYLNINTIFFYSTVYVFVIYLFFVHKFFFLITILFGFYLNILICVNVLLFFLVLFKIQNILSIKYFLAISSYLTILTILNFFLLLDI